VKKLIISILIILLLILGYFALAKGIKVLHIRSINNIKQASQKLDSELKEANELSSITYPAEVQGLEEAIKKLKISKQEYESKKMYNTEDSLGTMTVKTYKIHYLWTILGNYKKYTGVKSLNLDLKSTELEDVYDLEFTLVGEYTNITDFIYEIENDEDLNCEIKNFIMQPYTIKTTETVYDGEVVNKNKSNKKISEEVDNPYETITEITTSTTTDDETGNYKENDIEITDIYDPKWVNTKFTIEDIGITLD